MAEKNAAKAAEIVTEEVNSEKKKKIKGKKSPAKAAGLKSLLTDGRGTTYMTVFGKGSEAKLFKKIYPSENGKDSFDDIAGEEDIKPFDVESDEYRFLLNNSRLADKDGIVSDKPYNKRTDLIKAKKVLEKKYFNKDFQDNIHIQLIYQIIDIMKIMTVHSNNMIYELNNILRRSDDESDVFGYFSINERYEKMVENAEKESRKGIRGNSLLKKECLDGLMKNGKVPLAYFGNLFYYKNPKQKFKMTIRGEKEIYNILSVIGTVRQICVHNQLDGTSDAFIKGLDKSDIFEPDSVLFCVDKWKNLEGGDDVLKLLDKLYGDAIYGINKDFVKNNGKVNMRLLEIMYPNEKLADYLQSFYDYIVRKSNKNMGFSIKKLRERILEFDESILQSIKTKQYDSVRSKLYTLFDFAILRYYQKKPQLIEEFVAKLRLTKAEEEKEELYKNEGVNVWKSIQNAINRILPHMDGDTLKEYGKQDSLINENDISDRIGANVSYFGKMIYLLTMLLDGKEINDLLSTLINKFDNIASFFDTMQKLDMNPKFRDCYSLFADSKKISKELREINSICRMQKPLPDAKRDMYREAVEIFGTEMSESEIDRLMDKILCIKEINVPNRNITFEEICEREKWPLPYKPKELEKIKNSFKNAVVTDEDDGSFTFRFQAKIGNETGLRNFIASNVIESSRFMYLVRYSNVKKVSAIARNKALIDFQLHNLPETQIERYYKAIGEDPKKATQEQMINKLADIIHNINFNDFKKVKQNSRDYHEIKDKEHKIAIISLYLTMLYLIYKNLIYVNSRYVMAFQALERDKAFHSINKDSYFGLTEKFISGEKPILGKEACKFLRDDLEKSSESMVRKFRNAAAHVNVVQSVDKYIADMKKVKSYYGIYHYVMQRYLIDSCGEDVNLDVLKNGVNEYGTYNRDFVKLCCVPFGYNFARYKNLCIEKYFDKNDKKEQKKS